MYIKNFVFCVWAITLFFVGGSFSALAEELPQNSVGIQISPVRFDWELESGDVKSGKINVKNYTDGQRIVSVSAENFFVSSDSEHTNLFGEDASHPRNAFNVVDWFTFPENFVLEAGEAKDVDFIVTVPEDQPTNGYYGAILFQTTNRTKDNNVNRGGAEIGVNYRVGTMMTFAVSGADLPQAHGAVDRFDATKQIFFDAPVELLAEISNEGNIHYKMDGKMIVEKFGKKFAVADIETEVMYPGAVRTFEKNIPFGTWDFGMYTAHLALESEHGDVVLDADTTNFYVLPRQGLIYIGIGLLCVLIVIILFKYVFQVTVRRPGKQGE